MSSLGIDIDLETSNKAEKSVVTSFDVPAAANDDLVVDLDNEGNEDNEGGRNNNNSSKRDAEGDAGMIEVDLVEAPRISSKRPPTYFRSIFKSRVLSLPPFFP